MARNQVFISYSHKDKRWMADLETHLKPHVRDGSVTTWSDKQIAPGSDWIYAITSALEKAKVAVLLVTPNFLASDFIHKHELCPLLKKAEGGGLKILWIPVRASAHKKSAIARYQAVIELERPLAEMKAERDRAWGRVCEAIANAAKPLRRQRKKPPAPPVPRRRRPEIRVLSEGAQPRPRRPLLRELDRAMAKGELHNSEISAIVTRVLKEEPDLEIEGLYDWHMIVTGIRLSDELLRRVRRSAGTPEWQGDFAQIAMPTLIAVTKSLKPSPELQNVVIRLCDGFADRMRLKVAWPRGTDRFNQITNAIYKTCLEATSLEGDDVIIALKELKVSGRRR